MNERPAPGWIYVLTHPAWDGMGMVKIGRTGRNPRTRAAEITSVSGLLAPCKIAFCSPVSDMADAEQAVHRMLAPHRVRKRRELFRVDVATAQQVVRAVAGSLPPPSHTLLGFLSRALAQRARESSRYRHRPSRAGSWFHGRRHVPAWVSLMGALAAGSALLALLEPALRP
ncbi:MAG: GIY-YIG nuclease family protein [Janthinobacterium lividum]